MVSSTGSTGSFVLPRASTTWTLVLEPWTEFVAALTEASPS
ncbi:MAG: hypothetical protein R2697_06200 [Ilumatobacteraceae bacterium]